MMTSGGAAIVEASDKVIEKGREMASYVLEAASIWITAYRAPMMRRSLATPFIRCRARPTRLAPKGCGEAGCVGALPSVMEALVDALGEYDIRPHRHAGDLAARVAQSGQAAVRDAIIPDPPRHELGGLSDFP